MTNAVGITFLVILDIVLLAVGIYLALQNNELTDTFSASLCVILNRGYNHL